MTKLKLKKPINKANILLLAAKKLFCDGIISMSAAPGLFTMSLFPKQMMLYPVLKDNILTLCAFIATTQPYENNNNVKILFQKYLSNRDFDKKIANERYLNSSYSFSCSKLNNFLKENNDLDMRIIMYTCGYMNVTNTDFIDITHMMKQIQTIGGDMVIQFDFDKELKQLVKNYEKWFKKQQNTNLHKKNSTDEYF